MAPVLVLISIVVFLLLRLTPGDPVMVMLGLLFSLRLRLLPPSGFVPLLQDPLGNLKLFALPVLALGTHQAAVLLRLVRSSTLEVLGRDFMRVARMKGLREGLVMRRHA